MDLVGGVRGMQETSTRNIRFLILWLGVGVRWLSLQPRGAKLGLSTAVEKPPADHANDPDGHCVSLEAPAPGQCPFLAVVCLTTWSAVVADPLPSSLRGRYPYRPWLW